MTGFEIHQRARWRSGRQWCDSAIKGLSEHVFGADQNVAESARQAQLALERLDALLAQKLKEGV